MLNTYIVENSIIKQVKSDNMEIPKDVVWIDLMEPDLLEEKHVEKFLGIQIPTREEMREIELSNRLYQEGRALFMTITILAKADTIEPENHAITFILVDERLITIRYVDPLPFKLYTHKVQKLNAETHKGEMLFTDLIEAFVNRIADIIENIGRNIDSLSRRVFRHNEPKGDDKSSREKTNFQPILEEIGVNGDLISKTQESLISLLRLVGFMSQQLTSSANKDLFRRFNSIRNDASALSDHTHYLAQKVNFMLDATLGMINIQQNNIIKIFSVAAVAFLPPTLIASIYGMNFHHIPELDWKLGYPLAVALMFLSAYLPYRFFKRKGWL